MPNRDSSTLVVAPGSNAGQQPVRIDRLDHVIVDPRFAAFADVLVGAIACDRDDDDLVERSFIAHLPRHRVAVHMGQADIEQHGPWLKSKRMSGGTLALFRNLDLM